MTCATIRFPPYRQVIGKQIDTINEQLYEHLKSQGRIVLSRGGWIESHPLCSSSTDASYQVLAFGKCNNDVAFETVSGMVYPSSSSSLSYLKDLPKVNQGRDNWTSNISVVAYGGRRLSILTGGGLWSTHQDSSPPREEFAFIPVTLCTNKRDIKSSPCLEVSDWIHDVSMIDLKASNNIKSKDEQANSAFLLALGMVNNNCEIWGFRPTTVRNETQKYQMTLQATRLQCISCNVRCMTYSLSFHGWNEESIQSNFELPCLIAASGTVFGEILVWGVVQKEKTDSTLRSIIDGWLFRQNVQTSTTHRLHVTPSFRLGGHRGSVFSVKFGSLCEIVSTSDDRTVRLWVLTPLSKDERKNTNSNSASQVLESQSTHFYKMSWTGWGHTARVWDVSFASYPTVGSVKHSSAFIMSAGEDGMVRIWSPYMKEREVRQPLRGHKCESIWTVDVCEGIVITGANDGSVKLFDLESNLVNEGPKTFSVPTNTPEYIEHPINDDTPTTIQKKKSKKTKAKMNVIGMQFYSSSSDRLENKLLVATREGSLFSLDLNREIWIVHNSWSSTVTSFITSEDVEVDASTGACMAVRPNGDWVIVGTTDGLLISSELSICNHTTSHRQNFAFNMTSHRSIQSIFWLNYHTLLVFYARGAIAIYVCDEHVPKLSYIMRLDTSGIPLSHAYCVRTQDLYIGDSRGNLAYFSLYSSLDPTCISSHNSLEESRPNCVLAKVHAKEHITGIVVPNSGTSISIGNDGCITQCKMDDGGYLHKVFSIPVANVTGLRNIWMSNHDVIVGGYYGNDFVVMSRVSGYEFIRIPTGGRQRRQELMVNKTNEMAFDVDLPSSSAMVICTGQNSIDLHAQWTSNTTDLRYSYSVGHTFHGETINSISWIECKSKSYMYLLSGSNDTTVKLSKIKNNLIVSVIELPPHESCVRGVCASSHPKSESSLIVTCGGKLSIEFYLLHHKPCTESGLIDVSFLCSYRTLGTAAIDHRMNVVRSIPLSHDSPEHMVIAADSDGNIHIVVLSEEVLPRQTTIGKIIPGGKRPILCLDVLKCLDRILAFIGNTAGEIMVWDFTSYSSKCNLNGHNNSYDLSSLLFKVDAHSSGVNDLNTTILSNTELEVQIVVCSVGDDQTLSTYSFTFTNDKSPKDEAIVLSENLFVKKHCNASPLKAVKVINDESSQFCLVYTTGQDQFITLWRLTREPFSIQQITSSSLGTEGNCIDCIRITHLDYSEQELIAIGGEGIELQTVNYSSMKAAKRLHDTDYLLITAGAGFSADSGLSTYECAPAEYKELCDPSQLLLDASRFQKFWLNFTKTYRNTKHHVGYELIDQWCCGGLLPHLARTKDTSPWWVYTSNVDGHFRRFQSFANRVCEIHGSADTYLCSCRIGYSDGKARLGTGWDEWNSRKSKSCEETKIRFSDDAVENILKDIDSSILKCNHCQLPLRPNVLMFNDTDANVLNDICIQRQRYQTWEGQVEDAVSNKNCKLVILELGCGVNVPAVRQESEEVLLDCGKIIESQRSDGANGSVCLIRINPKDANVDMTGSSFETISIQSNAKDALQQIDFWLKELLR